LLIRVRAFATFSTIEKALAGCMKSFRGSYVVHACYTKLCWPHMNENSCAKVTISHESEMDDECHPDTETSRLVIVNYFRQTVLTAKQVFFK